MLRGLGAAALGVALAGVSPWGCASEKAPPLEPMELTQAEVDRFLDAGKDPRNWNITVRRGTAGPEFEFGNRPWPGKVTRKAFWKGGGGMPVLVAETLGGDEFKALVDTSARQCWLACPWARALDYRVFKEGNGAPIGEWADHAKGKIPGYAGVGSKIVLERLHVESPVFYVAPSRGMLGAGIARGSEAWRKDVAVVLGAGLLKNFSFVTLDFPGRLFAAGTIPLKGAGGGAGMALGDWKGRPSIGVRLGGVEEPAVVDAAGNFDVSLPAAALKGVRAAQEGRPVEMELVLGGKVVVPRVTVVTHESQGLPPGWPARVGWGVWKRYRMTFDWEHKQLWLEGPGAERGGPDAGGGGAGDGGGGRGGAPAPVRYRGVAP